MRSQRKNEKPRAVGVYYSHNIIHDSHDHIQDVNKNVLAYNQSYSSGYYSHCCFPSNNILPSNILLYFRRVQSLIQYTLCSVLRAYWFRGNPPIQSNNNCSRHDQNLFCIDITGLSRGNILAYSYFVNQFSRIYIIIYCTNVQCTLRMRSCLLAYFHV